MYAKPLKVSTAFPIYTIFLSIAIIILSILPLLLYPITQLTWDIFDKIYSVDNALYFIIILIIPALFNSLSDIFFKSTYILIGSYYKILLFITLIFPNILILFFLKSLILVIMTVNVQIMVVMTMVVLLYNNSFPSTDPKKTLSKSPLAVIFLFQASVVLMNFSFALQPLNMIILRSIALLFLLVCIVIVKSYVMNFMDILRIILESSEISIKDQELGVYLFSLSVCTGGYFTYTLLLLFKIDYDLALFFLILVQILSALPVLYLESRIAKRLVFQLQLELESKKVFLRTTSHEIRTPMNTIVLGLSLLRKEMLECGIENEDMFEIIKNLDESSVVILDLVNDLLTHDKIKEGTMSLEKTSLSLWKLVDHTIEPFHTQAKQNGVNLSIDTSSIPNIEDYYIDGDKHKLSQVFRNLLSNALKFTKKGKKVALKAVKVVDRSSLPTDTSNTGLKKNKQSLCLPRVHTKKIAGLEALTGNSFLQIEVMDEGAGISKENIGRLFKEIVQFNAAKLQGGKGSGLGMMITKGIVDLHGGSISVHSEGEGHGCTFTVFLPVYLNSRDSSERVNSLFSVGHQSSSSNLATSRRNAGKLVPDSTRSSFLGAFRNSRHNTKSREGGDSRHSSGFNSSMHSIPERVGDSDDTETGDLATSVDIRVIPYSATTTTMTIKTLPFDEVNIVEHKLSDVMEEEVNDNTSASSRHQDFVSSVVAQGLRILIVDDAKLNRKMLCRLIQGRCLETVEAENGFDAVEAVRTSIANEFPYDVILMDNRMPVMDGLTATKAIRELGYSGLIVGVTGDTQKDDYAAFLSHGANSVLSKPLDLQILDRTILDYFSKLNPPRSEVTMMQL